MAFLTADDWNVPQRATPITSSPAPTGGQTENKSEMFRPKRVYTQKQKYLLFNVDNLCIFTFIV